MGLASGQPEIERKGEERERMGDIKRRFSSSSSCSFASRFPPLAPLCRRKCDVINRRLNSPISSFHFAVAHSLTQDFRFPTREKSLG